MESANNPICIVVIGAVNAVGLNAAATAAAVHAGIDDFQEHPFMINKEGELYMLAIAPSIDTSLFSTRVWQKKTTNSVVGSHIWEKEGKAPS